MSYKTLSEYISVHTVSRWKYQDPFFTATIITLSISYQLRVYDPTRCTLGDGRGTEEYQGQRKKYTASYLTTEHKPPNQNAQTSSLRKACNILYNFYLETNSKL